MALLASGCGAPPAAQTGDASAQPPAANVIQPGYAPTPYSAAEIRDACRGRELRHEVVMNGEKKQTLTRFVRGSDELAEFEVQELDADGRPVGEPRRASARWVDLQAHGSFLAAQTTITTESCSTQAGTFACWRYEVRSDVGGKHTVSRMWFPKEVAGPPMRMETDDGHAQSTFTLLERR